MLLANALSPVNSVVAAPDITHVKLNKAVTPGHGNLNKTA